MEEGIRLGGAYYEVDLNDEPLRQKLAAAQTEVERVTALIQAALARARTAPAGPGISTTPGQTERMLGVAAPLASGARDIGHLDNALKQMGGSLSQVIQAMTALGVVTATSGRAASTGSAEFVQSMVTRSRAIQQVRDAQERYNQQAKLGEDIERERQRRITSGATPAQRTAIEQAVSRGTQFTAAARQAGIPEQTIQQASRELALPPASVAAQQRETGRFQTLLGRQPAVGQVPSDLVAFDPRTGRYRITRRGVEAARQFTGQDVAAGQFATPGFVQEQARLADIQQPEALSRLAAPRLQQQTQVTSILANASAQADREQNEADRIFERQQRQVQSRAEQRARLTQFQQRHAESLEERSAGAFSTLGGRLVARRGFTVPDEFQGRFVREPGMGVGAELAATGVEPGQGGTGGGGSDRGFLQRAFQLTPTNILRGGAALLGIPLGISVIAGSLRLVNDLIRGAVEGQIRWEDSIKGTAANYGEAGRQVTALASNLARAPGFLGGASETAENLNRAQYLQRRFGFGAATDTGRTDTPGAVVALGGAVSQAFNIREEQQRTQIQTQLFEAIQRGGNVQVPGAGTPILLEDEMMARRLGITAEAFRSLSPTTQATTRTSAAFEQGADAIQRARDEQRGLSDNLTKAQAATEAFRADLQRSVERGPGGFSGIQLGPQQAVGLGNVAEQAANARPNPLAGVQLPPEQAVRLGNIAPQVRTQEQAEQAALQERVRAEEDANEAADAATKKLLDLTAGQEAARAELERFKQSAQYATAQLQSWAGSLESTTSLATLMQTQQIQGQVTQQAVAGTPVFARTQAQIEQQAQQQALVQAFEQQITSPEAATALQNRNPLQRALEERLRSRGVPSAQAQAAIAQAQQTQPAFQLAGQAQTVASLADMQAQQASNELQRIHISQQERIIARVEETTRARRAEIEAQRAIAPLQLQEMDLQQQITVAGRQNLGFRAETVAAEQALLPQRQEIQRLEQQISQQVDHQRQVAIEQQQFEAQQGLLGPQRQVEDTQREIQGLAYQLAGPAIARLQGQEAAPVDQGAILSRIKELAFGSFNQQQAVFEAQGPAIAAQRASEDEQARVRRLQFPLQARAATVQDATKQQEAAFLLLQQREEAERLTIEGRLIPLQAAKQLLDDDLFTANRVLTVAQQQNAEIQHQIELQNLDDEAAQAYWQHVVNSSNTYKLNASDAEQAALLASQHFSSIADALDKSYGRLVDIAAQLRNMPDAPQLVLPEPIRTDDRTAPDRARPPAPPPPPPVAPVAGAQAPDANVAPADLGPAGRRTGARLIPTAFTPGQRPLLEEEYPGQAADIAREQALQPQAPDIPPEVMADYLRLAQGGQTPAVLLGPASGVHTDAQLAEAQQARAGLGTSALGPGLQQLSPFEQYAFLHGTPGGGQAPPGFPTPDEQRLQRMFGERMVAPIAPPDAGGDAGDAGADGQQVMASASFEPRVDGGVAFNGPVNINNRDDIERIANESAMRSYDMTKAALTHAFEDANPSLMPNIAGAQ